MSMTSSNSSLVDTSTVKLVDQPAEQQVSVELHPMSSKPPKPPQGPTTPRLSPSAENMPVTESTRAVENRCQVVIPSPESKLSRFIDSYICKVLHTRHLCGEMRVSHNSSSFTFEILCQSGDCLISCRLLFISQ